MPEEIILELWHLLPTIVYFFVGLVLFGGAVLLWEKLTPFSIRKEIEEDHNTALAIIIGSGLIAMALLLAAAIR